jgi:hypothetical protein
MACGVDLIKIQTVILAESGGLQIINLGKKRNSALFLKACF